MRYDEINDFDVHYVPVHGSTAIPYVGKARGKNAREAARDYVNTLTSAENGGRLVLIQRSGEHRVSLFTLEPAQTPMWRVV